MKATANVRDQIQAPQQVAQPNHSRGLCESSEKRLEGVARDLREGESECVCASFSVASLQQRRTAATPNASVAFPAIVFEGG